MITAVSPTAALPPDAPHLAPFVAPLWLRGLCVLLGGGAAFAAVLSAGRTLTAGSGPQRYAALAPLLLLVTGVGLYLAWLRRREGRLWDELQDALAQESDARADTTVVLRGIALAARVHHPHLCALALQHLAALAEDAGESAVSLRRGVEDFHLAEERRHVTAWPALSGASLQG